MSFRQLVNYEVCEDLQTFTKKFSLSLNAAVGVWSPASFDQSSLINLFGAFSFSWSSLNLSKSFFIPFFHLSATPRPAPMVIKSFLVPTQRHLDYGKGSHSEKDVNDG